MSDLSLATDDQAQLKADELSPNAGKALERRLFLALLGGTLLLTSWLAGVVFGLDEQVAKIPAFAGAVILAMPLAIGAWHEIRRGQASSDALATAAISAAMFSNMF